MNSLGLGVAVVAIDMVVIWSLVSWGAARRRWMRRLGEWPTLLPPLALGVGAVALPGLLLMGADTLPPSTLGRALRIVAILLDPYRTPGVLLVLAVAAVHVPLLAQTAEATREWPRAVLVDSALNLGASRAQARNEARCGASLRRRAC